MIDPSAVTARTAPRIRTLAICGRGSLTPTIVAYRRPNEHLRMARVLHEEASRRTSDAGTSPQVPGSATPWLAPLRWRSPSGRSLRVRWHERRMRAPLVDHRHPAMSTAVHR